MTMTTLTIPSLERRLLETVTEEVTAGSVGAWPPQSLQLCVDLVRKIIENTSRLRQALEEVLGEGVESRSFARNYSPVLSLTDDQIAKIRRLVEQLAPAKDAASANLAAEFHALDREYQAFRDLLAGALSRAAEGPRTADWTRIRAAEEAHARGETKPFSRR